MTQQITIVGGGLAGAEAAYYLANKGWKVQLFEMRPSVSNQVHQGGDLAELVCSNSFRSDDPNHPVGLLKREMETLGSLIMAAARSTAVPAGGALAVDRVMFSRFVTGKVTENQNIDLIREEVTTLPQGPAIIAAGPLCSEALAKPLFNQLGDSSLYFYDAIAPVVEMDSIDLSIIFSQSRYDKGEGQDYLNIPLDKEEYLAFHDAIVRAEKISPGVHEKMKYFEGCLPIEVMAARGVDTLRYGPMKPVGLKDPRTGNSPYAVVQLRQDDFARSLWNMVGFQTQMKWGEQKRIFRTLPGMKKAKFTRFGMIHRNTYLNSPCYLDSTFRVRKSERLYIAGQISGVEGYLESAASGFMAAFHLDRELRGEEPETFPRETALGSLAHYISFQGHKSFQPTNVNFGLFPEPEKRIPKSQKRTYFVERSWREFNAFAVRLNIPLVDLSVGNKSA